MTFFPLTSFKVRKLKGRLFLKNLEKLVCGAEVCPAPVCGPKACCELYVENCMCYGQGQAEQHCKLGAHLTTCLYVSFRQGQAEEQFKLGPHMASGHLVILLCSLI